MPVHSLQSLRLKIRNLNKWVTINFLKLKMVFILFVEFKEGVNTLSCWWCMCRLGPTPDSTMSSMIVCEPFVCDPYRIIFRVMASGKTSVSAEAYLVCAGFMFDVTRWSSFTLKQRPPADHYCLQQENNFYHLSRWI